MKIIHKIFLVLMLVMFIVVLKGKVSRNVESCDSKKKNLNKIAFTLIWSTDSSSKTYLQMFPDTLQVLYYIYMT